MADEAKTKGSGRTVGGVLVSCFPALVVVFALACIVWFARAPGVAPVAGFFAVLYVLPLGVYRLHGLFFPLREGVSSIVGDTYSPWYGGHQIQLVYIAFPALEAALRLLPGVYSAWLRLWGSRIGAKVYWTPNVDIVDRGLLDVGEGVVFGHACGAISHVIKPSNGGLVLFVQRVQIGDRALIGAGSYLGPGVEIAPGAMLPVNSMIMPRQKVAA